MVEQSCRWGCLVDRARLAGLWLADEFLQSRGFCGVPSRWLGWPLLLSNDGKEECNEELKMWADSICSVGVMSVPEF